jgi:hypothetical protein
VVRPNSGLLAALLKSDQLSGVLRWKVTLTKESLSQESAIVGWKNFWVDLSGLTKPEEVISELGRSLDLPDYFDGSLEKLSVLMPEVCDTETRAVLAISGWQEFVGKNSKSAADLAEALELGAEGSRIVVIVSDPSGNYPGLSELALA